MKKTIDGYEYEFFVKEKKAYIKGAFINCCCIATDNSSDVVINTNNYCDVIIRKLLPYVKGAKLISSWTRDSIKDDPNGRKVKVGTIRCQKWDLKNVFNKAYED